MPINEDESPAPVQSIDRCLTPKCLSKAGVLRDFHGLCIKCWGRAKALIAQGKTTLEELVSLGLAISQKDEFTLEFERRKQDQKNIFAGASDAKNRKE